MSTYPPASGGHPDPYEQPQQPYADPYGPSQQPAYGQQPPADPYGWPQQPPYGQQPPADPYGRPPDGPYAGAPDGQQRPNPYEELGRLGEDMGPPGPHPYQPPADYPAPPPKPRRRRRFLFGCLGAAVVLVLGVGGVAAYFVINTAEKLGQYRLAPPSSFQGLSSDPSNALLKQMAADTGDLSATGVTPVSAAYSTHVGDRMPQLVLSGGYGNVIDPGQEMDSMWQGLSQSGNAVSDKTDEPSGPLGGTVQCGVATFDQVRIPVCAWVDNSTVVMVIFSGRVSKTPSHPDLRALDQQLLKLRAVTEVKK